SGGKDAALVGILCKHACDQVLSVMMPCSSRINFEQDLVDAQALVKQYDIDSLIVDLTPVRASLVQAIEQSTSEIAEAALINIAPRLRMTTLYTLAQSHG